MNSLLHKVAGAFIELPDEKPTQAAAAPVQAPHSASAYIAPTAPSIDPDMTAALLKVVSDRKTDRLLEIGVGTVNHAGKFTSRILLKNT